MTVIVVIDVPEHTHGVLSRWTQQLSPTTYLGHLSARVRTELWTALQDVLGDGKAVMAWHDNSEQQFAVISAGPHRYLPIDRDGLTLIATRNLITET